MSKIFLYTVSRDYGFAPNPFGHSCTLATCKPTIREKAKIGDWVVGVGASTKKYNGRLIYAMKIERKLTFQDYWLAPEFQYKKAIFNGSKKKSYGDNIYYYNGTNWIQEYSHHSKSDGGVNVDNYNRDLKSKYILVSKQFYYFGKSAPFLPETIANNENLCRGFRGFRYAKTNEIVVWIENSFHPGYYDDPIEFHKNFVHYDGVS